MREIDLDTHKTMSCCNNCSNLTSETIKKLNNKGLFNCSVCDNYFIVTASESIEPTAKRNTNIKHRLLRLIKARSKT